jgi:23S rRNA (adenine1618-N6)-methyltransferase
MDVGTGASFVYPLLGAAAYKWSFIGSEANRESFKSAQANLEANRAVMGDTSEVRLQPDKRKIFEGVLQPGEELDFVMCNPPFYESSYAFRQAGWLKQNKLLKSAKRRGPEAVARHKAEAAATSNNFRGVDCEVWTRGGEVRFVQNMITESLLYSKQVLWFTSLVSNKDHLPKIRKALPDEVTFWRVVKMDTGHKKSRFLMWTYLEKHEHMAWARRRGWARRAKKKLDDGKGGGDDVSETRGDVQS